MTDDQARPGPDDYSNRELAEKVKEIAEEYTAADDEKVLLEAARRLAIYGGLTTGDMNAHARDA